MLHHCLNTPTAAFAAIADRIEAIQAGIFEPSGVQMSSFVFGFKELKSLRLSEASAAIGMVFKDEIHKRLANNHTHLNGLAGVFPNLTTTALENCHFRRPFQHQIPSERIRDNLFYVLERNIVVMGDYRLRKFRCEHFGVIMTG
jgi:hypothetical protein